MQGNHRKEEVRDELDMVAQDTGDGEVGWDSGGKDRDGKGKEGLEMVVVAGLVGGQKGD